MRVPLHRSQLIAELKEAFPELKDDINAEMGQLVFEVEAFRRYTQAKIDSGDIEAVGQCFSIARKYYLHGNRQVRDVIDICFVEDLIFQNSKKTDRDWAWQVLPAELQEAYTRFHDAFPHS